MALHHFMSPTSCRAAERWFYIAQPREECEEFTPEAGQSRDTSHSSHPSPSENASSTGSGKEAASDEVDAMPTGILEL
jgi:hypothetical protein